jgi:hypothetical protein
VESSAYAGIYRPLIIYKNQKLYPEKYYDFHNLKPNNGGVLSNQIICENPYIFVRYKKRKKFTMYTAVSAIGVRLGIDKKWEVITLADWTLQTLYGTFRKVQITLLPPSSTTPVYLDLENVRNVYATFPGTVSYLLTLLGAAALPTTTTGITLNTKTARFKDAFKSGYEIKPVTDANVDDPLLPNTAKNGLRLTRFIPVTNYTYMQSACMVSINGFYHSTQTDGTSGLFVPKGMVSLRKSGQNQVGLLHFGNVGSLQYVPIVTSMVSQVNPARPVINLGIDLTGKSVMLVLGGYLHVLDTEIMQRVAASSYRLDFTKVPMLERFFESRKYLDLSMLPVDTTPVNLDQISASDVTSDAFILAYLQLTQSFFVIVDTEQLYIQKHYVKRSGMPDVYTAYQEPRYPLVTGLGRHPEYWSVKEDGQYSLTVYDAVIENKIFNSTQAEFLISVDNANWPSWRGYISQAYLLQLSLIHI